MVSKASDDLPLPLGPVTTVNFPSARSRSIPLRLFWRAPRTSMQPRSAGAITQSFASTVEPTGNYPRAELNWQILAPPPRWNIGLWPVRPAEFHSADLQQRKEFPLGTQTWRSMFRIALPIARAAFPIPLAPRHPKSRRTFGDLRFLFAILHRSHPEARAFDWVRHRLAHRDPSPSFSEDNRSVTRPRRSYLRSDR